MKDVLETLGHMFKIPEKIKPGCSFADLPQKISFQESNVVIYGVPLDLTTSFGKGTSRGPEAIRLTSARQTETFIFEENKDIQRLCEDLRSRGSQATISRKKRKR